MKVAVLGPTGLLGRDLVTTLKENQIPFEAFGRELINSRATQAQLEQQLDGFDTVVNAIAFTDVDLAENQHDQASQVNCDFVGVLAQASTAIGSRVFHVSTDFVFDGRKGAPYTTADNPKPLNVYGESKLRGEQLLFRSGARHSVFRTSWLFGGSKPNFVTKVAERLLAGRDVTAVTDQRGNPTWTVDVANVILDHLRNDYREPIVHAVSSGSATKYDLALEVQRFLRERKHLISEVFPGSSIDFVTPAERPADSRLENRNTKGLIIGPWHSRLHVALEEMYPDLRD